MTIITLREVKQKMDNKDKAAMLENLKGIAPSPEAVLQLDRLKQGIEEKIKSEPPTVVTGKKPTIRIKKTKQAAQLPSKPNKIVMDITAEQVNLLVNAATTGVCYVVNKENLTPLETSNFSTVLYEIGKQQGWWDNISFLPYLILVGASVDLVVKIANKPDRVKKSKVTTIDKVINKIERKEQEENKNPGDFIVVDESKLMEKLSGGGKPIYEATSTNNE